MGVIDRARKRMDGTGIRAALSQMDERGSGEGAGYAVYGAFLDFKEYYALHVFFDNLHETKPLVAEELSKWGEIEHQEVIPTYEQPNIKKVHIPWRFFFRPDLHLMPRSTTAGRPHGAGAADKRN